MLENVDILRVHIMAAVPPRAASRLLPLAAQRPSANVPPTRTVLEVCTKNQTPVVRQSDIGKQP